MKLSKKIELTEVETFGKKFPLSPTYRYTITHSNGKIISVETTNKKIIDYLKELGMSE